MKSLTGNRWRVSIPRPEVKRLLENELKISPLIATLLINRGIDSVEKAYLFLSSKLNDLHNPFLMLGMKNAVDRILKAIYNRESIGVYGDYDVDGITASSIIYLFLKRIGVNVYVHIPDRLKEGYGVKEEGILRLKDKGAGLIITADCGISNKEEIVFASRLGIDVIITDHHEIPGSLPSAYAILNPKQSSCTFPFKELSGVGVAFNLLIGLRAALRDNGFFASCSVPNLKEYLDLVALGTLADIVPLHDENRIFVKYGVIEIEKGKRPGLRALREVSGIKEGVNVGSLIFQIIPRINAPGRMGEEDMGFKLLTSEDWDEARILAQKLNELNAHRQEVEGGIWKEVQRKIEGMGVRGRQGVILLSSPDWHPGVIGIVASRIVEKYYCPAFLVALKDGRGRGSARGIRGCNIVKFLEQCEEFLESFGGHSLAGGFTIREEMLGDFYNALKKILATVKHEDLVPEVCLDAILGLEELSEELIEEASVLSPHGIANPEPVFGLGEVKVVNSKVVGKNHLSLYIEKNGFFLDAIGFKMGSIFDDASQDIRCLSLAYTPFIDNWQGRRRVRLKIKDIGEADKLILQHL